MLVDKLGVQSIIAFLKESPKTNVQQTHSTEVLKVLPKTMECTIKDFLSHHHLKKFQTLLRGRAPIENNKLVLGIGDHLLYFNPLKKELNCDGYYDYQSPSKLLKNPKLNYMRRVWAQGQIDLYRPLLLDQEYICHERIKFIKKVRGDHYVCIERTVSGDGADNLLLRELRTLAYTNSLAGDKKAAIDVGNVGVTLGTFTFEDSDVITYGHLSLNPHRIHWDRCYCKETEGYDNIIVQGPFALQVLLKFAQGYLSDTIKKVKYRNTNYIYPQTEVEICIVKSTRDDQYHVWMWDVEDHHKVFLKADVSF